MHNPRFDLDIALAAWRRSLAYNAAFTAEDLDELAQHVRDQVAGLMAEGLGEEAAFRQAMREMGDHGTAEGEYGKVYWGKRRRQGAVLHELQWRFSMLTNYLKIAIRNVLRQKLYAGINVFGLAAGLAGFILILLYVQHEYSYDHFYTQADRIYRVVQRQPGNVFLESDYYAVTPAPLAAALVREFGAVTHATTIQDQRALLNVGDRFFWEEGIWADASFFDVFTLPLLRGASASALAQPASLVLTESLARKLFGDDDPIGKTVVLQHQGPHTVTGVMPDLPAASSLTYAFITSITSQAEYAQNVAENQWTNNWWYTFFTLADGVDATRLEADLQALVATHLYEGSDRGADAARTRFLLQPLTEMHLGRSFNRDLGVKGDASYVYLFLVVAVLILAVASVNYTNLAVARSIRRAREVGLRKVAGAGRRQLMAQFLGESVLMAVLALVLALGLAHLTLPVFGALVERPLQIDYLGNGLLVPGLLALVVLVGLLAGSYPALFMTSLQPIQVLKGATVDRPSRYRVQRLLVIGQYAVSIALVTGSLVVYQQLQFVTDRDLGYDRAHVVTVRVNDPALRENYGAIRDAWLQNPRITAVTYSWNLPTDIRSRAQISGWEGSTEGDELTVYLNNFDYDYREVFGIELAAGRTFSREIASDPGTATLINETAARALGWSPEEAVGKHFRAGPDEKTIAGVLKDFHMHSMHLPIEPLVVLYDPAWMGYLSVRVRPGDLSETLASMEQTVKSFTPYPFEYQFLDETFDQLYEADQRLGETFGFFTTLTLIIASLGLFGLAAYAAEQRTREIGIRKVLGASIGRLVTMLSKDFLVLVGVAFLIAVPPAYLVMQRWLDDFAYRIALGPGVFLLAGGIVLLIALLTVSYQAVKAALADPVKSLRHE